MSEIQTMQVTTTTTTTANNNNTQTNHSWILHLKIITMLLLILLDIAINSTEYDTFSQSDKRNRQIQLLIFIAQLVLHIIACSILIIASCQTFLFQVGLIGIVLKDFAHVIVMLSLYFGLSVVSGTFRWVSQYQYLYEYELFHFLLTLDKFPWMICYLDGVQALSRNADTYLWDQPSYLALSSIQKIGKTFDFFITTGFVLPDPNDSFSHI